MTDINTIKYNAQMSNYNTVAQNRAYLAQEHCDFYEQTPDTFQCYHSLKATTRKKCCIGSMSAILPGLGFWANGETGKAVLAFTGVLGGAKLVGLSRNILTKPLKIIVSAVGITTLIGTYIWQIVNSVKNTTANIEIV